MKNRMNRTKDTDQYIYSLNLWKILGLYHIFNSDTKNICGYNVFHIIIFLIGVPTYITCSLSPIGFYKLMNDMIGILFYIGGITNCTLGFYKMIKVLYHSKALWQCFSITRLNFLSYHHYDRKFFTNWQRRTIRLMFIYIFVSLIPILIWILSPLIFNSATITKRNLDGSYSVNRLNVLNFYIIVSSENYNLYYDVIYLHELIVYLNYSYYTMIFDIVMIVWCCAICFQLDVIIDGIQSLGHRCSTMNNLSSSNLQRLEMKCDVYDYLKAIIKDHQKLIRHMDDCYSIFRWVILFQIFVSSSSFVIIWSIGALNFSVGENGDFITTIKMISLLPFFSFQQYITCYFYGSINEKKDLLMFALYSSNWTAMDIKSKKLILFTMKMINANNPKLKYTASKVINLELFTSTMRISYSIFSMLLKYNTNKKK